MYLLSATVQTLQEPCETLSDVFYARSVQLRSALPKVAYEILVFAFFLEVLVPLIYSRIVHLSLELTCLTIRISIRYLEIASRSRAW